MSSHVFAKSRTTVLLFGSVLFSRESVCTASTSRSLRITYMAHSRGWSNPTWNLFAPSRTLYSSVSNAAAVLESDMAFMPASVYSHPLAVREAPKPSYSTSMGTLPEKATSADTLV